MVEQNERILLQGGRIIDPSQAQMADRDFIGDILIENGRISAVDRVNKIPTSRASKIIDARGLWIVPGLIDAHSHLREPGLEYKETIESGTRAAVAGGFTSVCCMPNTQPVNDSPYVTAFIREKAAETGQCRVFPVGAISKGLKGEELAEVGSMVSEGARAISDDGGSPLANTYLMRKAMDYAKAFDIPVISHAEDPFLVGQGVINESALSNELGLRGNPAAAEEIMVAREIALCRLTRASVHIAHITTHLALEHLLRAKEAGLTVTTEATPHHLTLNETSARGYDTNFKVSPPLRSPEDVEALRAALSSGLVDMIATDHAPHGIIDKAVEFDQASSGIIGFQTALSLTLNLVHTGVISPARWVETVCLAPAKLMRLPFGTLKIGSEADIAVIDPEAKWTFTENLNLSKSKNSPFLGKALKGRAVMTLVAGEIKFALDKKKRKK